MGRGTPMAKRNLPQAFEIDKIRFRDCFSAPSLRHFAVLITGWALTVGTHTITQVILATGLHESEHFATIYKFLGKTKWELDRVAFEVFRTMAETLLPGAVEYEAVVDDTLNSHVGKRICGAGVQHDGNAPKTGKPIGYGVCFVTIGLVVQLPGISDRAFCLPYAARLWWPRKTKVKPAGGNYKSKSQLAVELIRLTRSWLHNSITLRVIVDGGYANRIVIRNRPRGVHITGKLRKDAALYGLVDAEQTGKRGRPRQKGERLPTPASLFRGSKNHWDWILIRLYAQNTMVSVHQFDAIWYNTAGNEPLSIVLVHDPCGTYPDAAFFDTDIEASDEETIKRYSHRWSTEITNRETKNLLGSADPQCRLETSVTRAPMIAYWSYSLLVVWFVTQFRMGKDLFIQRTPWYFRKKNITFSDMLAAARHSHFDQRISRDHGKRENTTTITLPRSTREPRFAKQAKL